MKRIRCTALVAVLGLASRAIPPYAPPPLHRRGRNRPGAGTILGVMALQLSVLIATGMPEASAVRQGASPDNPYIVDPEEKLRALSERPDALGWNFPAGDPGPEPGQCRHWQGVQRSFGPGPQYLFASRSGVQFPCANGLNDFAGDISIIEFGSRDQTGERWRSNRFRKDTDIVDTPPRSLDRRVNTIYLDGSIVVGDDDGDRWPHYLHPGGMQLIGDVLVVPLEHRVGVEWPTNLVLFLDVSNPVQPTILSELDPGVAADDEDWNAGVVGVTRLEDGRYLLLVTGQNEEILRFFISNGTNLRSPALTWTPFVDLTESEIEAQIAPADWPSGDVFGDAYQMLNFVRTGPANSQLYLFGARNTQPPGFAGDDLLDLYQVLVDVPGANVVFDRIASRELDTRPNLQDARITENDVANFRAGTGIYVSPTGELLFYATEHDNTGPAASGSAFGSVKAGEWRALDIVRPDSPTLLPTADAGGPYVGLEGGSVGLAGAGAPPSTAAWAQLFQDEDYTGRYIVVDYRDRHLDSWDDFFYLDNNGFDPRGFEDEATSVRWFAPVGCTITLNHDEYSDGDPPGGDKIVLPSIDVGGDYPGTIAHLGDDDDDEISSLTFGADCDDYYNATMDLAWDLNADGTFETPGPNPLLSLAGVDGPQLVNPVLQATDPIDLRIGTEMATVQVANVAPTISSVGAYDPSGGQIGVDVPVTLAGLPVKIRASFTDPGVADTQVASVDWGDGTIEPDSVFDVFAQATGGVVGTIEHTHTFGPGTYDIRLEVTDDDGGSTETTLSVEVLSIEDAIDQVVDKIDDSIVTALNPRVGRELTKARDALTGHARGVGADGALDELAKGNLVAAMQKFTEAISALNAAEAAGAEDLSELKDLIVLSGSAVAYDTYSKAKAATSPATEQQQSRLDEAAAHLDEGNNSLAGGDHFGAIDAYAGSVGRAAPMCSCT